MHKAYPKHSHKGIWASGKHTLRALSLQRTYGSVHHH